MTDGLVVKLLKQDKTVNFSLINYNNELKIPISHY